MPIDQVQITDVSEPVPVHLWLDHIISTNDFNFML